MSGTDPRIEALLPVLERYRRDVGEAWRAVPPELLEAVPDGGGWSVANVLEHLALTERGITKLIAGFVDEAKPRDPDEPFDAEAFGRRVDMPGFLDRSRKVVGRQPPGELGAEEAWVALAESRRGLLEVLDGAPGLRLEDASRPHPTGTVLDGYQWVAFVGLHEGRHAAQIREISGAL